MHCLPCNGYVRDAGNETGRGVFASRPFTAGEIVEVCPVVILKCDFKSLPVELQQRVFNWSALAKVKGAVHALALGYGSMYNHANPANLWYEPAEGGEYMRFIAASAIEANSELTINYNGAFGKNTSDEDDWFEARGITPFNPKAKANKPLVPTRNGEAPLLAAQRQRYTAQDTQECAS